VGGALNRSGRYGGEKSREAKKGGRVAVRGKKRTATTTTAGFSKERRSGGRRKTILRKGLVSGGAREGNSMFWKRGEVPKDRL